MGNVHYVGAEPLTFERIEEILTGNMKLELTPEVKERIQRCRDYLDRKIETQDEPLYGITTGLVPCAIRISLRMNSAPCRRTW